MALKRFFSGGVRNREPVEKTVIISLDEWVYRKLKERAAIDGETESEAIYRAFERGMESYWANQIRSEQEDYELTKVLHEQSSHDYVLLESIVKQNMELRQILKGSGTEAETGGGML